VTDSRRRSGGGGGGPFGGAYVKSCTLNKNVSSTNTKGLITVLLNLMVAAHLKPERDDDEQRPVYRGSTDPERSLRVERTGIQDVLSGRRWPAGL